jgi:hypothetical protein
MISRKKENIGNISRFGSIVFSPPFGEANRGSGIAKKGYEGKHGRDVKLKDRCDSLFQMMRGTLAMFVMEEPTYKKCSKYTENVTMS